MSCDLSTDEEPYFSPEGRILQVEYAFKAVELENVTAVGLVGADCAVVAIQKKSPTKNILTESVSNLHVLAGNNIGCATVGRLGDAQNQVHKVRYIAYKFELEWDYPIPVDVLCQKIASINQVFTQNSTARVPGFCLILIAYEDDIGATVYKTDPGASCNGYMACAVGTHSEEATNYLNSNYTPNLSQYRTIQLAIDCLLHVRSNGEQPEVIEVGVVSKTDRKFRILDVSEIEEHRTNSK